MPIARVISRLYIVLSSIFIEKLINSRGVNFLKFNFVPFCFLFLSSTKPSAFSHPDGACDTVGQP